MDKIYSAFISSTEKVSEYRDEAIDALLDLDFYFCCMEHFTAQDFVQIKSYIRRSDFVLVIMGTDYGSTDIKSGKSWTQLEFEYACEIGKPVLVIKTPELEAAISNGGKDVDKRQKKFYKIISEDYDLYTRSVGGKLTVRTILSQYVTRSSTGFLGWSKDEITGEELKKWAEEKKAYNLNGTWYHFHYSESDRTYIKMGKIEITQEFTPSGYRKCRFVGQNDGVKKIGKDKKNQKILVDSEGVPVLDKDRHSTWEGDYILQPNDITYTGIYTTIKRYSEDDFAGQNSSFQRTRGIHDFDLDSEDSQKETVLLRGMFYDIAPSVKCGKICACRSKEERDARVAQYLITHNKFHR